MTHTLELHVSFADEPADATVSVLNEAGATGVQQVPGRGMIGVETIVVAILVTQAMTDLVIKLLALWKCGVIVDLRGVPVTTQKDCSLPRGSVLIIHTNDTRTTLVQPTAFELGSVIKSLLEKT